jgi:hypothetical protein
MMDEGVVPEGGEGKERKWEKTRSGFVWNSRIYAVWERLAFVQVCSNSSIVRLQIWVVRCHIWAQGT